MSCVGAGSDQQRLRRSASADEHRRVLGIHQVVGLQVRGAGVEDEASGLPRVQQAVSEMVVWEPGGTVSLMMLALTPNPSCLDLVRRQSSVFVGGVVTEMALVFSNDLSIVLCRRRRWTFLRCSRLAARWCRSDR